MKIVNFAEKNSELNRFVAEIRDIHIQQDRLSYRALLTKGEPEHIHIASVIASQKAIEYITTHFPEEKTTVWVGAIDPDLNEHSYIVPGLGDAGDLAYGEKE